MRIDRLTFTHSDGSKTTAEQVVSSVYCREYFFRLPNNKEERLAIFKAAEFGENLFRF